MSNLVESLGKELEQLDREYATDFAGHSRLSRDIAQIDRMIKKAASIVERADQIPAAAQGAELTKVREAASNSVELYKQERSAIARAQEVGPAFEQFSLEATSANFVFSRYMRHFAGQDRATRDAALLGELVDDLRQIDKRMTQILNEKKSGDFEKDRQVVRDNLKQYQDEIELIEQAQKTGSPEEQASALANVANGQFAVYQNHFAGEPRVSRRPALLMRVVGTLKKVRERMNALKAAGLAVEFNDKNMSVVDDRLGVYENELAEVRKIRQATAMTEIMGELGGAANKLFDEYRSNFADKPRTQADLTRLAKICDKLSEIRRQMVEMSWAEDSDMNTRNLEIVNEQMAMFEGEYEAVARAQAATRPR